MKMVAVTACPIGIAHTYMAADAIRKAPQKENIGITVETQGAMGIEGQLSNQYLANADLVLIASDIEVEHQANCFGAGINPIGFDEIILI